MSTRTERRGSHGPTDGVTGIMEWPVATASPGDTLADAAEALASGDIGVLAVLSGDDLVGMLSERDVVAHAGLGSTLSDLNVSEVMAVDVVTISRDSTVLDAGRLMKRAGVRHLPVVGDGELVGLVSERDVLEVLLSAVDEGT